MAPLERLQHYAQDLDKYNHGRQYGRSNAITLSWVSHDFDGLEVHICDYPGAGLGIRPAIFIDCTGATYVQSFSLDLVHRKPIDNMPHHMHCTIKDNHSRLAYRHLQQQPQNPLPPNWAYYNYRNPQTAVNNGHPAAGDGYYTAPWFSNRHQALPNQDAALKRGIGFCSASTGNLMESIKHGQLGGFFLGLTADSGLYQVQINEDQVMKCNFYQQKGSQGYDLLEVNEKTMKEHESGVQDHANGMKDLESIMKGHESAMRCRKIPDQSVRKFLPEQADYHVKSVSSPEQQDQETTKLEQKKDGPVVPFGH
ncbi:hypothetical protein C8J56DRAFT_892515 [Mycena floridula]|nr:hypothetical protein C8J56DRAFT_892515 [Mycena floridula]